MTVLQWEGGEIHFSPSLQRKKESKGVKLEAAMFGRYISLKEEVANDQGEMAEIARTRRRNRQAMSKDKDQPTTQWHPLFAALLRPLMQDHFQVQTNVPVGDAPRLADILLLRHTREEPNPFQGLWSHLTERNVLEFKGPTVSARLRDLDLLVEVGLGIDRWLNEEQQRQRQPRTEPEQVSFWYVVKSLGRRFLADARRRLPDLEQLRAGLWRSHILERLVFLVSSDTFATEPESVPLHMLVQRSLEQERELARLIVEQPNYWQWYASALSTLHPAVWNEVKNMARAKNKGPQFDFRPLIEDMGMRNLLEVMGIDEVIDAIGVEAAVKRFGGKRVLEAIGPEKLIDLMGVDWLVANLPPSQLKKLKERLK
jgi:hypothetical protein